MGGIVYQQIRRMVLVGMFLNLVSGSSLLAVGTANIGNEVPSARAAGQGYVGIAGQNDDPTVVWSNPAGITNLKGTQATIGLHWENLHGKYEALGGAETKAKVVDAIVPNFSVTHLMNDGRVGFGLTVQSPYGLETHWSENPNSPLRYVATDSRLNMALISPVLAIQVTDKVSIGGGPDYVRLLNGQLDRKISVDGINTAFGFATTANSDGTSSMKADGSGWGGHVGLMVEPNDKHAFGVTYHLPVTINAKGRVKLSGLYGASAVSFGGADYVTAASADIELPENVQFGYAFKPTEKLTWETNAAWYHWSAVNDFRVNFEQESNTTRLSVLNTGNPTKFDNRDVWSIATGVNYKVNDRWQARTGFWYEPHAMPETNFHPGFLDLSRYGVSTGLGYAITKALVFDLAYNAVFFKSRSISNGVGATTTGNTAYNINGTYANFANLVSFNITYKFAQ